MALRAARAPPAGLAGLQPGRLERAPPRAGGPQPGPGHGARLRAPVRRAARAQPARRGRRGRLDQGPGHPQEPRGPALRLALVLCSALGWHGC
ncbi:hypothetical protein FOCC_FOCC008221 [Frankliniella occidentalis]|nr:hypothetical protein FOCC_FOCC008221 [Frankliniella occidentalis]